MSELLRHDVVVHDVAVADVDVARIITDRFLDARDPLAARLAEARARLEQEQGSGGVYFEANRYLAMAFVTAVEGNTAETERLVRVWLREAAHDNAELAGLRHHACRALAMAAAASAAVECLRSGLVSPSQVIPFVEPFLPYYDSLRNDPGFVELVAEIQGEYREQLAEQTKNGRGTSADPGRGKAR